MIRSYTRFAALACAAATLPVMSWAFDIDLVAQAFFREAVTVVQIDPLDFSPGTSANRIDFSGAPNTDTVVVGPDGVRTVTGSFFTIPNATGQAGNMRILGSVGETVSITCDATAALQNAGGNQVEVSAIEFSTVTAAAAGAGFACAGIATPIVGSDLVLTGVSTTDVIFVGGTIVANSLDGVEAGAYSTTTAGDGIDFQVLYL